MRKQLRGTKKLDKEFVSDLLWQFIGTVKNDWVVVGLGGIDDGANMVRVVVVVVVVVVVCSFVSSSNHRCAMRWWTGLQPTSGAIVSDWASTFP
jgi:hypothetical protein